ncbi:recombinase family protein [Bradyrhizobium sp. URHA0013]|uniref:recombinase family protein n=1 Tax=Bradyrhizobium sp. URHA0013 TaxID=1380352 RepID=UPI000489D31C|nr:recombinase family protein [Bradyrhizobium sp. URHA0013]
MLVGYARVSTVEQDAGFAAQLNELTRVGCEKLFSEKVSSVAAKRAQLDAALEFTREGDVLVVTRLDRLARSVADFVRISDALDRKKVSLRVLAMGLDTGNASGRLMLNVLSSVAQFEREVMLERQREGIAKAKAAGKYKGRTPTARAKSAEVIALFKTGEGPSAIAKATGIGRASCYRILAEAGLMQANRSRGASSESTLSSN